MAQLQWLKSVPICVSVRVASRREAFRSRSVPQERNRATVSQTKYDRKIIEMGTQYTKLRYGSAATGN
jgi:hypothetical protein